MDVQGEKRGRRQGGKYVSHSLEDVTVGVLVEEGQCERQRGEPGTVRTVHRHFLFFPGLQHCRAVSGEEGVDGGEGYVLVSGYNGQVTARKSRGERLKLSLGVGQTQDGVCGTKSRRQLLSCFQIKFFILFYVLAKW